MACSACTSPYVTTNPQNPTRFLHGAGAAEQPSGKYYKAAQLAAALTRDVHYTVDEKQKAVLITDEGYEAAEDVLEVGLRLLDLPLPVRMSCSTLSSTRYTFHQFYTEVEGCWRGMSHVPSHSIGPSLVFSL